MFYSDNLCPGISGPGRPWSERTIYVVINGLPRPWIIYVVTGIPMQGYLQTCHLHTAYVVKYNA